MTNKVVLEELFRMRELMGMKVLSETKNRLTRTLLMEAGKTIDELIGVSPKSLDNLSKSGVDFANDLTKLSDEFTSRGIRSFADLSDVVARKEGVTLADVTDDMIESYIKNDDVLYKSILAKAAAASADQVDVLMKNATLTQLYSKIPGQLNTYKTFISTTPSARNVDLLISSVDDSIDEVSGMIDDIQSGKIPGFTVVPKELMELYENLLGKKTDLESYKKSGYSRSSSTIDADAEAIAKSITDSIGKMSDDAGDVVDPTSYINNILTKLERDSLIKYPKGLSSDLVRQEIKANLDKISLNISAQQKAFERMSPSEQAAFAQRAINNLKTVSQNMKDKGNKGPNWFKRFFFGAVDEMEDFGRKTNKLSPMQIVKGTGKLYLAVGGLLAFGCLVMDTAEAKQKGWDTWEGSDVISCIATTLTWLPDGVGMLFSGVSEGFDKDYENTAKDFAEWVKKSGYTEADYSDDEGYTYKDKNGDRQPATYDAKEQTFK
jgi:hypothetical protein